MGYYIKMAPRDGDNGMDRRPRHPAAQPVAPVDDSDGEEDDIVDDDVVDDRNEDHEEEDPIDREIRMQRLRTENAELMATKMEQDLMLQEINWKTEDIKAATLAKQEELKQLQEARRLRMEAEANGGAGANP